MHKRRALIRHLQLGHQPAGYYINEVACGVLGRTQYRRRTRRDWHLFLSTTCGKHLAVTQNGHSEVEMAVGYWRLAIGDRLSAAESER